jgi:hypothetical protein
VAIRDKKGWKMLWPIICLGWTVDKMTKSP